MILKKLYTEPGNVFKEVSFVLGVNFIFARKDDVSELKDGEKIDVRDSLNGVGKSLLLDFIDFCLLGSTQAQHNPRLNKAKPYIGDNKVVLVFEINGKEYCIKRSFTNKKIEFGEAGSFSEYSEDDLKTYLCDLIFSNSEYEGKYYNTWLRRLIPFFVKIHKKKKKEFQDPIRYIEQSTIAELIQYHLLFLGLNNSWAYKNFQLISDFKEKAPAVKGITRFLEEKYGFNNRSKVQSRINELDRQVKNLEESVSQYELKGSYEDNESRANEFTKEIKKLTLENRSLTKTVESYFESIKIKSEINTKAIKKIYEQVDGFIAEKVTQTLDEAIEFRKELASSRAEFLKKEIARIQEQLEANKKKINDLDKKRAAIFNYLDKQNAIEDLTSSMLDLQMQKQEVNELKAQNEILIQFTKEAQEIETEMEINTLKIAEHITALEKSGVMGELASQFYDIYEAIYPDKKKAQFSITEDPGKDAKYDIHIEFPKDDSKGINQARTLVYDLFVLLHAIEKNIKCPRFLIHDGIFDGMDKAQFIATCSYIDKKVEEGLEFQYIITMNEEGTLSEEFGSSDLLNPDSIAQKAIVVLTPKGKLLGKTYS